MRAMNTLSALGRPLPGRWELAMWAFLIAAAAVPRIYLDGLLGCYLWYGDAASYCRPAFEWLGSGVWESDPRRGPVYSLLIAGTLKISGNLNTLMAVQHWLGGASVLAGIGILRVMHGARCWLPISACGVAYAVYAGPVSLEHLVRNETLLFAFATAALGSWFMALRTRHPGWLVAAGISSSLIALTKDVFLPFPFVVIAGIVWLHRQNPAQAARQSAAFLLAAAVTLAVGHSERILGTAKRPPEPQSGILLFGRVAQFTVLNGGIEPEIKALIRSDIEDYLDCIARDHRLRNNTILKDTAVPRMRKYLEGRDQSPADLDRLCRRLAIEAIAAHPGSYLRQVAGDFWSLNTKFGSGIRSPDTGAVRDALEMQEESALEAAGDPANIARLRNLLSGDPFFLYHRIVNLAWLFQFVPVLLTTLLLPVLFARVSDPRDRIFWAGCGVMWLFTLVLLSTVGRPLNRYLLPVTPVMFWTLSTAVIYGWRLALSRMPGSGPTGIATL